MFGAALRVAIGNLPALPPAGLNPDFANVELLINNGTGTEGNQDMTDMSLRSRVTTFLGGTSNARMDTDIVKFTGVPTLELPVGQNGGLTYSSSFPQFGTQDFTIESWIRPHASPTNNPARILAKSGSAGRVAWRIERNTAGNISFLASSNGITVALTITTSLAAAVEVWSWIVVQREGNNFTIWIQGVRDGTPTVNSLDIHDGNGEELRVGIQSTSVAEFRGSIGPSRITLGQAIFIGSPASIIVPSAAYPVDILELETTANRLELETTTDNLLLEDASGILVLQETGDGLTLEDGSGRLALD